MPKNYLISEELCDTILTYLSHQPYRDVFQLMPRIQGLSEHIDSDREQTLTDFIAQRALWDEFLEYENSWKPKTNHYDPDWVEEMGA